MRAGDEYNIKFMMHDYIKDGGNEKEKKMSRVVLNLNPMTGRVKKNCNTERKKKFDH